MNRVKAIYRGWGIPCAGKSVYHPHHREEWLRKITQASVRRRAELYYEQLDVLVVLRKQARQELLALCFLLSARSSCREQEAQGLEIAPFDSGPRSDPRGRADGHCPNTPSLPCQAAALEIQWVW